jgi:hypothetical protein
MSSSSSPVFRGGRDLERSSSTIRVLSAPVKVVARGSRKRFLGCDPKVTMGVGVDGESSSAFKRNMNTTTTLKFATIRDIEASTIAAMSTFVPPPEKM